MITSPAMPPNADLIRRFYTAFAARDPAGMAACYHDDVRFSDEVFPDLKGPRAGAMWRMLCERGNDLAVTFADVRADDQSGTATWEAVYTFTATGRKVRNRIVARFRFQDGKIVEHRDAFDFWAWSRQALGPAGWLLGWTPALRRKVQRTAGRQLDRCCEGWGVR